MTETIDFGALRGGGGRLDFVLVVTLGTETKRFPIQGTLTIGKHADNDVTLDAQGVSRHHLELRAEGDSVLVKDLGSKNGTFFNGARITEARLGAGSVVRAGGPAGVELTVELKDKPQLTPSSADRFGPLVGQSVAMRSVFSILERCAPTNATILIHGETGTGKEVVATAIHQASPRKDAPFVVVDCGAIPHHLIESELFGHRRGAFTDAREDRTGAFEAADGGTLFLDEIGELPIDAQPKLLRAVESKSVQRLGESERRPVNVRLVAATNRDLKVEVEANRFRRDLFFRLAVVSVELPPLRDRGQDVIVLAKHILETLGQPDAFDVEAPNIAKSLLAYGWPGNVRELKNALERAVFLGAEHGLPVSSGAVRQPSEPADAPDLPFKEAKEQIVHQFERAYLDRLMGEADGNISGAARKAGIDRNYLYRLLKKHGLSS